MLSWLRVLLGFLPLELLVSTTFAEAAVCESHGLSLVQTRKVTHRPSKAKSIPSLQIAPGVAMPQVVLGAGGGLFQVAQFVGREAHARVEAMAKLWLSVGGRGFDTAQVYADEAEIGNAWRSSGLARSKIFLLTKLVPPAEQSTDWATWTKKAVDASLTKLKTAYIDLLLIHRPQSPAVNAAVWRAMEDIHSKGKLRALGVSNFDVAQMQALNETARVPIALNQRKLNVLHKNEPELQYCLSHGITYQAYTPLGDGVLDDVTVNQIAAKHNRSQAQVALRWIVQRGATVTVQSESKEHLQQDMDIFDWELTGDDMSKLASTGS